MQVRAAGELTAIALVAAVMVAACGSDRPRAATPTAAARTTEVTPISTTTIVTTTTTRSTTPIDPQAADEVALRKLDLNWHRQALRLAVSPNASSPELTRHLAGELLSSAQADLLDRAVHHRATRAPNPSVASFDVRSITITQDAATLTECSTDDFVLFDQRNGAVINDAVVTRLFRTTASRSETGWRLTSRAVVDQWEGISTCYDD